MTKPMAKVHERRRTAVRVVFPLLVSVAEWRFGYATCIEWQEAGDANVHAQTDLVMAWTSFAVCCLS